MIFADGQPTVGQEIRIRWAQGNWIDYGKLRLIRELVPGETWLLSSEFLYQNSVCRYYDEWEVKV